MLALVAAVSSLLLPFSRTGSMHRGSPYMMAQVDEFEVVTEFMTSKNVMTRIRTEDVEASRDIKRVRVFDGDYAQDIIDEVTRVASACIEAKGSFSIAIPGGSVVSAFAGMDPTALDYSKVHVFLCNEKIPSYPCIAGALDAAERLGIPAENVHGFGEGTNATELAVSYNVTLATHSSIDHEVMSVPSVDMMLLGTGPDGHVGCLFPDSPPTKASGTGKVVLAGNDERADGDYVALSMDVMCASKIVLISAAGAARAPMVAKALSGDIGLFDCPAGMVDAVEQTLWFVTEDALTEYDRPAE